MPPSPLIGRERDVAAVAAPAAPSGRERGDPDRSGWRREDPPRPGRGRGPAIRVRRRRCLGSAGRTERSHPGPFRHRPGSGPHRDGRTARAGGSHHLAARSPGAVAAGQLRTRRSGGRPDFRSRRALPSTEGAHHQPGSPSTPQRTRIPRGTVAGTRGDTTVIGPCAGREPGRRPVPAPRAGRQTGLRAHPRQRCRRRGDLPTAGGSATRAGAGRTAHPGPASRPRCWPASNTGSRS